MDVPTVTINFAGVVNILWFTFSMAVKGRHDPSELSLSPKQRFFFLEATSFIIRILGCDSTHTQHRVTKQGIRQVLQTSPFRTDRTPTARVKNKLHHMALHCDESVARMCQSANRFSSTSLMYP